MEGNKSQVVNASPVFCALLVAYEGSEALIVGSGTSQGHCSFAAVKANVWEKKKHSRRNKRYTRDRQRF